MSNYGHYTMQYHGNKIIFPKESFLIKGISYNQDKLTNIGFDSLLSMEKEPCNKYDSKAIKIIYNNNLIGYVPNQEEVKKICEDNINDNLKIINIKRESDNRNIGIRVIPEKYYTDDLRDNSIFKGV